jgi:hypothetical protein
MRLTGFLTAIGLVAFAPVAHAQEAPDALSLFKSLCWSHAGQLSQSIADADAQHWLPVPDALIGQLTSGQSGEVLEPQARMFSGSSGMTVLLVMKNRVPNAKPSVALTCAVLVAGAKNSDGDRINLDLANWLGAKPAAKSNDGNWQYAFTEGPTGRQFQTPPVKVESTEAWTTGLFRGVILQSDASRTMVGLMLPER